MRPNWTKPIATWRGATMRWQAGDPISALYKALEFLSSGVVISGYCVASRFPEVKIVYRYFKVFALSAALVVPVMVSAQEREHNNQSRHYEDKAHNDSHEWNTNEDQAYRRYLQEHHMKYHDFAKAKRSEQEGYW